MLDGSALDVSLLLSLHQNDMTAARIPTTTDHGGEHFLLGESLP
jgi:hypothetical protein